MAIRILIVDDHSLIRDGLRVHLGSQNDFTVVGEAGNGEEAVAAAERLRPDVIIMDLSMPVMNGLEATRIICQRLPSTAVLILSMYDSARHCAEAVNAGALGYVVKESAGEEVIAAIRTILTGRRYFGRGVTRPAGDE